MSTISVPDDGQSVMTEVLLQKNHIQTSNNTRVDDHEHHKQMKVLRLTTNFLSRGSKYILFLHLSRIFLSAAQ